MKKLKRILHTFILAGILAPALVLLGNFNVSASAYVLYEKISLQQMSKDTYFKAYKQVTDAGLRDIYVLTVPLNDPYLSLAPVGGQEFGKKETVYNIVQSTGAIAGINGDFFGMAGNYSAPFGPEVRNGQLISVNENINAEENNYASFFLDEENNPFILYLQSQVNFYNNDQISLDVTAINKVTDMVYPTYIDRSAYENTAILDSRFEGLVKLVVEDGYITYISEPGETVEIPELNNGFIITMSSHTWAYNLDKFAVGQTARIEVKGSVDFSKIKTAIGGGGRILLDGQLVKDSGVVPTGRQPRTVIGITQDKTKLIMMVVDGRTHSVGATNEEIANLLLREGAYNALNLDGGGSTTMVVKNMETDKLELVNTLSDGSQRRIMNSLAIFENAPMGPITSVGIVTETNNTFNGNALGVKVYGYDDYLNKIELPQEEVAITASDSNGQWRGGYFYPTQTGKLTFSATYGQFTAEKSVQVMNLSAIDVSPSQVTAGVGGKVDLTATGQSADGYQGYLYHSGLSFEVVPPELGYVENGAFVGTSLGAGYIKISLGNIARYIDVTVGYQSQSIHSFENNVNVRYTSYPDGITGSAGFTQEPVQDGTYALALQYQFEQKSETQAAYAVFQPGITLPNNTISLKMAVYGNHSGKWLRGRLVDANGQESIVDFARDINWDGWKDVEVTLPEGLAQPVTLERFYVVSSTDTEANAGAIYIDQLSGVVQAAYPSVAKPESTQFKDHLETDLNVPKAEGSYDIAVLPQTLIPQPEEDGEKAAQPENYNELFGKLLPRFTSQTTLGILAGATDVPYDMGFSIYDWSNSGYTVDQIGNVTVMHLTAKDGGLYATDSSQWEKFSDDITQRNHPNVLIVMDYNPLRFNQTKEFELFHSVLQDFREAGKSVMVVSASGDTNSVTVKDGIRYINLGRLYKEDGATNQNFKLLRIRVINDTMYYELQDGIN